MVEGLIARQTGGRGWLSFSLPPSLSRGYPIIYVCASVHTLYLLHARHAVAMDLEVLIVASRGQGMGVEYLLWAWELGAALIRELHISEYAGGSIG